MRHWKERSNKTKPRQSRSLSSHGCLGKHIAPPFRGEPITHSDLMVIQLRRHMRKTIPGCAIPPCTHHATSPPNITHVDPGQPSWPTLSVSCHLKLFEAHESQAPALSTYHVLSTRVVAQKHSLNPGLLRVSDCMLLRRRYRNHLPETSCLVVEERHIATHRSKEAIFSHLSDCRFGCHKLTVSRNPVVIQDQCNAQLLLCWSSRRKSWCWVRSHVLRLETLGHILVLILSHNRTTPRGDTCHWLPRLPLFATIFSSFEVVDCVT